jgi:hypothetical protein
MHFLHTNFMPTTGHSEFIVMWIGTTEPYFFLDQLATRAGYTKFKYHLFRPIG